MIQFIKNNFLSISGALFCILSCLIYQLSFQFEDLPSNQPILGFICVIAIQSLLYLLVCHYILNSKTKTNIFIILIVFFMGSLLMIFSKPILCTDMNRYLWDGASLLEGINPYLHAPIKAPQMVLFDTVFQESGSAKIWQSINNPSYPTIYPPMAQLFFAWSQWIFPWSETGLKFLLGIIYGLTLGIWYLIFKKLEHPTSYLLLLAWNPLFLKEFMNSGHIDLLFIFFISLFIFYIILNQYQRASFYLGLSILVKWVSLILLPLWLIFLWNHHQKKIRTIHSLMIFTILIFSYLPFISAGSHLFLSLKSFSTQWETNASIYTLFKYISLSFQHPKILSRYLCLFILLIGILIACRHLKNKCNFFTLIQCCLWVEVLFFLLFPVGNPWYISWFFPFLLLQPRFSLFSLTLLLQIYYLDFYFRYRDFYMGFLLFQILEYGLFFILWILEQRILHPKMRIRPIMKNLTL